MNDAPLTMSNVRSFLRPRGIAVLELPDEARTAPLAANAVGSPVATIVKSLLFMADDEPVLVLAAGDRRVNTDRLAAELSASTVRLAKPEEVVRIAGYPVGGVPPVAHRRHIRTLLDRHLLEWPEVYAAAGADNAVFAIDPVALLELSNAEVTDVVE